MKITVRRKIKGGFKYKMQIKLKYIAKLANKSVCFFFLQNIQIPCEIASLKQQQQQQQIQEAE